MGGGGHGPPGVGHDVWGNMAHFRGVITHSLSPFEQRIFAGWISHGVPNTIRRIKGQFFRIGIPFFIGYAIYDWAETTHTKLVRKDPKFYEHEYAEYLASPEHAEYLKKKAQEEAAELKSKKK
ncbi:cytochrome b-c1 complex subunit 8-like [Paramacrobiotus metropolitanus]|uniref:cytochrome b-c1 complex subunit 8-like n=1 Tax=Paramacrobiotus metropolitanus TaxID=2943436 RepID=UPI002445A6F6|nr:cytochrome b-c1 complex subunit 8-like [Paramacrobiotus metropolitanus]